MALGCLFIESQYLFEVDGVQEPWEHQVLDVLKDWQSSGSQDLILSPDVDGLTTACLLSARFDCRIAGIYTGQHLLLVGDGTLDQARNALWLDHDVSGPGVRCIGQHLVHHRATDLLPRRDQMSWNPNTWQRQSWEKSFTGIKGKKQDKYPFATAHFVARALGSLETDDSRMLALLAHADGAWFALHIYRANGEIWHNKMFPGSKTIELMRNWAEVHEHRASHQAIVEKLRINGIKTQVSRSPRATLLDDDLRSLTGNQSVKGRPTLNQEQYLSNLKDALGVISDVVGSSPMFENKAGLLASGERESHYPNRIDSEYGSFDQMMIKEQIFSHAFTDQRTLQYTKYFGV